MSVNKAILMGNVGQEPNIKNFDNGGMVAQLTLATTKKGFTTKDGKSRKPISYSRTQEKNKFNSAILILENQEIYTTDRKTKKKSKVILYQYKK
jgi:hypothetical protein